MPAPVVVGASVATSLAFVLQLIGYSTPHWYKLWYGSNLIHAGIFTVCSQHICWNYFAFLGFFSIHYLGFAALQGIGTILLFSAVIVAAVGLCNKGNREKQLMSRLAGLLFSSAGCLLSAVIWFSVAFYNSTTILWAALSDHIRIEFGYSFYLASVSGALIMTLAIMCCVVGQNMAPPPTVIQAPAHTTTVITSGNPQVILPNQQHPYGQPVYGQQGYSNPAYMTPGQSYDTQYGNPVVYTQPQEPAYQTYQVESKQPM